MMRLVEKRPSDVPPGQWEFAVGWTINLHANCGSWADAMSISKAQAFSLELEERVRGPVSLATIDWIWDQYGSFTTQGKLYADKYRPTRSPEFKHAEPGCFLLWVK